MKKMQNFQEWLSSVDETPTLHQRRLAALTRLNRVQLSNATSDSTWFLWSTDNTTSVS